MQFSRKKLKNGMTLIVEKRDLPVVALGIANPFGASHETSEIKGIAHFIEHLLFTGTKTRTHEDISREIEKKGGVLNAYTSNDITCYWFKLPSEHVFSGLEILTDMLNNALFGEDKFEKEKKVILEEIKMYHDTPTRHIYDKIVENLYGKPFGEGVIGSEKTITALSREFVFDFFKKNYDPANFIVVAVGDVDINKLAEYLESKFSPRKTNSKTIPITLINRETVEKRPGLDQAHFMWSIHAPPAKTKEHYALEVLDAYLANGMSSKLFLKIREEKGLAYTVRSMIATEKTHSYYTLYVGTRSEAIPEIKKIILEEFANLQKISQKDIAEAKQRLIGLRKISMEESTDVMNELLMAELTGKAESYYEHEKNILAVTAEEIKKLAKIGKYSTASIIPK